MSEYLHKRHNVKVQIYHLVFSAKYRRAFDTNQRFKTLQYGLKRLIKVEQTIQERFKREVKRYIQQILPERARSLRYQAASIIERTVCQ